MSKAIIFMVSVVVVIFSLVYLFAYGIPNIQRANEAVRQSEIDLRESEAEVDESMEELDRMITEMAQ